MTGDRFVWLGVLTLNALWTFALPTPTGRVVAALGAVNALLLALASDRGRHVHPLALACFLLPAISLFRVPMLVFWRLDGRASLILAWMAAALVFERGSTRMPAERGRVPVPPVLFMMWASMFWLTVVLDLGISRLIVGVDRTVGGPCRGDSLTAIVSVWETTRVSEHLFLGWRSAANFAERVVYENHVHPFLLTMYTWIAAVRFVAHVPTYVASNSTSILYMGTAVGALVVLMARSGLLRSCRGPVGFLALFVACGVVITTWRFWFDLYRFNTDNPYPLFGAMLVIVYALLLPPAAPRLSIAAAIVFVALGPIHAPMLVLAVACLFWQPRPTVRAAIDANRLVLLLCAWATAAAALVMALPWMLAAWKGYRGQGSTFLFRSGLDGDTSYFRNMIQAMWSACPVNCCGSPRPIMDLLFPAFLPLAAFCWMVSRNAEVTRFGGFGRLLLFLATPYLVSLIFFPQSVSIHPYLYDHLLIAPAVIVGAAATTTDTVRSRLRGPGLLAFLLFAAAIIMSNLIAIAQGIARMP